MPRPARLVTMNNMSPDHSGLKPKAKGLGLRSLPTWALCLGVMLIVVVTGLIGLKALVLVVVVACYLVLIGAITAARERGNRGEQHDD